MDLTNIPLPYSPDMGKRLEGEEKERAAREATPLDKIREHCTRVGTENSVYPRHYERY